MPFASARPASSRPRSGISIVEVLTALVVVSVGLLGMAGTAAISLRAAAAATRERHAIRRLDLRLAALAAGGCDRAMGGSASDAMDSLSEQWTVVAAVGGAALVDARAEWRDGARTRAIVRRSAILC